MTKRQGHIRGQRVGGVDHDLACKRAEAFQRRADRTPRDREHDRLRARSGILRRGNGKTLLLELGRAGPRRIAYAQCHLVTGLAPAGSECAADISRSYDGDFHLCLLPPARLDSGISTVIF
jgi:hypothetical protein